VRDDAGAPAPSIVQVDGALHWTNAGVLALKGLDAGAHRVVVFPCAPISPAPSCAWCWRTRRRAAAR
jgi:hypothetical protein